MTTKIYSRLHGEAILLEEEQIARLCLATAMTHVGKYEGYIWYYSTSKASYVAYKEEK